MYGTDVTLFYPGFDTFVQQCRSVKLVSEDTTFVTKFSIELSKNYDNERSRNVIVQNFLGNYLLGFPMVSAENMGGAVICGRSFCLLLETRNEVGTGGCDSYMEAVAHYAKLLRAEELPAPCFLLEMVGVHMCIYGAVFAAGTVCVDRLTNCLWLAFQPNNHPAMAELARTLKALKVALCSLKEYYRSMAAHSTEQPSFHTYVDKQGKSVDIEDMEEIKNHVFRGKTNTKKRVVVKFVEQYGENAHKVCEDAKFAPALLSCAKVTSRFCMVVMEEIEDAVELTTFIQQCKKEEKTLVVEKCKNALRELHYKGFCHGDFRPNNILVRKTGDNIRIWVIDFDWAGKIGQATYPLFMNHIDIEWHPDASDGKPLHSEHDLYWLNKLH